MSSLLMIVRYIRIVSYRSRYTLEKLQQFSTIFEVLIINQSFIENVEPFKTKLLSLTVVTLTGTVSDKSR